MILNKNKKKIKGKLDKFRKHTEENLKNNDSKTRELDKIINVVRDESKMLKDQISKDIIFSSNRLKDETKENENKMSKNDY